MAINIDLFPKSIISKHNYISQVSKLPIFSIITSGIFRVYTLHIRVEVNALREFMKRFSSGGGGDLSDA